MQLTRHGKSKASERTLLTTEAIVDLIRHNLFVSLGSYATFKGVFEYLLFYSDQDRQTKIAIVTKKRSVLVSVWHDTYHLPATVSAVDAKKKWRALRLYKNHMHRTHFKERVAPTHTEPQPATRPDISERNPDSKQRKFYLVSIEVLLDGRVEYERVFEQNKISSSRVSTQQMSAEVEEKLYEIVEEVERVKDTFPGKITYQGWHKKPWSTTHEQAFVVSHEELVQHKKQTAAHT